ncbi:hypothetical protein H8356DRAFT_1351096 [Neocallimastix lanati (nom. inval.)]|nr:hypothetical protein H8356DRAFT_1351096 [Neocallimastix sp. JGI-2020a]
MKDNIEIEINKSKIYRCTEYKTLNKCKSLIILNNKKEVLKYESLHNHLEKEIDVSISVAKHKIKEEIKKNSIHMNIKPKHIFNAVSQEMGLICPEYTYLFSNYHKNIFADGTFYAAPKFSYQLFITRTYVGEFNMSNTLITKINFHCDFEQGISNDTKKVFPNINIKNCVWHYKRSLEKQKNILCYHKVKNNNDKKKTYLIMITKGELKELRKKKQKIFSATDKIKILIENYNSKEINLFYNGCNRNELVKLWKDCLIDLNDININLK